MKKRLYGIQRLVVLAVVINVLVCNIGTGILLGNNYEKNLINDLRKSNINLLNAVALNVDHEAYQELIETQNVELPIVEEIHEQLQAIKGADFTYLYTQYYDENGSQLYFGIDSEEKDSEDFTPFGEPSAYDMVEEEYQALKQVGYYATDVYEDGEWGQLISLAVAIKDKAGNVVGSIACDFSVEEIEKRAWNFKLYIYLLLTLTSICQIICIMLAIGTHIIKPINKLKEVIMTTARYDFRDITLGSEVSNEDNEISEMAIDIIKMREELKKKAELTQTTVNEVTQIVDTIYQEMNTSQTAMEQINVNISSLVMSVDNERQEASNGNAKLSELTDKLSVLEQRIVQVEALMQEAQQIGDKAGDTMYSLEQFIVEQEALSGKVAHSMIALNQEAEQITKVVGDISAITRRTNLVAINASIEAASAGEVGKGFAVVAGEIKDLSDDTFDFTKQIESNIMRIDECTQDVGQGIGELKDKALHVESSSDHMRAEFNELQHSMKVMYQKLEEIEQLSKEITVYKEETVSAIASIAQSSTSNAEIAESLSANTEEQFAITENMLHTTQQLIKAGEALKESIAEYKL